MTDKTDNVMSDITARVIAAIEAGTAPWQKPWESRGPQFAANLATDRSYNGLNALFLRILGDLHGSPYWLGFGQALELGGNVRKGEKSTAILAPLLKKERDAVTGEERQHMYGFRVVRVFNAMQCDGDKLRARLAEKTKPADTSRTLDASMLDEFARNTGADIVTGGDVACYMPDFDRIRMPDRNTFKNAGGYYGTLLHELIHWTGHKSRLDRLGEKNKRGYAFEELIAELGCYYASETLQCPNEAENHASYLASWLKALQNDQKYLWQAASLAEKAAKFLIATANKATEQVAA